MNVAEAAFTLKLIRSLIASGLEGSMIGVITLYKSQMYKVCAVYDDVYRILNIMFYVIISGFTLAVLHLVQKSLRLHPRTYSQRDILMYFSGLDFFCITQCRPNKV